MGLHALVPFGLAWLGPAGHDRLVFGRLLGHDALLLLSPEEECHARSHGGGARAHTGLNPASYDAKPCPAMCASARVSRTSPWRWVIAWVRNQRLELWRKGEWGDPARGIVLSCSRSTLTKPVVLGECLSGGTDHQCGLNRGRRSVPVFTSASLSWIAPSPTVLKPSRPSFGSAAMRIEQSWSEPSFFAGPTSRSMSFGGGWS